MKTQIFSSYQEFLEREYKTHVGDYKPEYEDNMQEEFPTPEFDPSKDFEISANGKHFHKPFDGDYVCFDSKRNVHVLYSESEKEYFETPHIRNTPEPFTAAMLEVGEWMETEPGKDGKINLIRRLKGGFVDVNNPDGGFSFMDTANKIRGKRVKVNITTEEI